jgi:hypothetical protein
MANQDQQPSAIPAGAEVAGTMDMEDGQKIIAYHVSPDLKMPLVPASSERAWMDATRQRFAYRCLPLLMGNQHGWWILNNNKCKVIWDGTDNVEGTRIKFARDAKPPYSAATHFGHGILTFLIPYLFRTPPGWNLILRGPSNWPKDGIQALDGLVETDWAIATASMNWIITRTDTPIVFEKDEPICMIVPVRRHDLENLNPEIRSLKTDPALERHYTDWSERRSRFNHELHVPESDAVKQGWERDYFRGRFDDITAPDHQTKLHLKPFDDKR